ncbi:MAG: alginate O-acetyltransferase AlgX-related protein [Eubacteriales bacterium]
MNNSGETGATEQKFRLTIRILTLAVFLFILFLPSVLMLFGAASDGSLSYESAVSLEAPSGETYLSGSFQDNFEGWLSRSYPFRIDVMLTYNQLKYDIESFGSPAAVSGPPVVLESDTNNAETETEEPAVVWDDSNPLYAEINQLRAIRKMTEPTGYKGSPTVIIGKSGYLYENGYINEYLGYSKMYREVTEERVNQQVEMLEYISKRLSENGCAFVFVLTPSKASQYPDAIPDWYKKQNSTPDGYVRPYDYLVKALAKSDVPYIDSTALYAEVGLQDTFPKTGTHWNKPAAYETTREILNEYERQTGTEVRRLTADRMLSSKNPPGFGNPEQDIFGIAYSGVSRADSIVDDLYYWPDVYVKNDDCKTRINILLQGGSFAHDFTTYFSAFNIASKMTRMYYNGFPSDSLNAFVNPSRWKALLKNIDYVIFECNEQFVRSLGGNSPYWASDKSGYEIGPDIYESLYNYLKSTEQGGIN